ncbi:MAG: hypothetical protein Q8S13_07925 [Dehalococcoidia bacterium]|nr:hypothetical protein [Dehalococcoidia bacterium]
MIAYDLVCTAVSERADLFAESIDSLLRHLDQWPARLIVHEDVRPGSEAGAIEAWLNARGVPFVHRVTSPSRGMGPATVWCMDQPTTPIVLYTQEDWRAIRAIPVADALALMQTENLHHIRFNKRKTMRAKHADTDHPWQKVEKLIGGHMLCVSDHWYTQTSLWRVDAALPNLRAAASQVATSEGFVARFNDLQNTTYGDGKREWHDQAMRHDRLRTYIWGGIGEPKYIEHLGSHRGTGTIKDHLAEQKRGDAP